MERIKEYGGANESLEYGGVIKATDEEVKKQETDSQQDKAKQPRLEPNPTQKGGQQEDFTNQKREYREKKFRELSLEIDKIADEIKRLSELKAEALKNIKELELKISSQESCIIDIVRGCKYGLERGGDFSEKINTIVDNFFKDRFSPIGELEIQLNKIKPFWGLKRKVISSILLEIDQFEKHRGLIKEVSHEQGVLLTIDERERKLTKEYGEIIKQTNEINRTQESDSLKDLAERLLKNRVARNAEINYADGDEQIDLKYPNWKRAVAQDPKVGVMFDMWCGIVKEVEKARLKQTNDQNLK